MRHDEEVVIHPLAALFPEMSEAEFQRLKDDIDRNGLREPITYWRNQLIDGRHRLRACQELRIDPFACELDYDHPDPIGYAISQNLHRRHLKPYQSAIIAARMETLSNGQRKEGMQNCIARDDAAKLCNVSPRSVATAKVVIDRGCPELADAVQAGKIPLALAAKLANAVDDHDEQCELIKGGADAVRSYFLSGDMMEERDRKQRRSSLVKAARKLEGRDRIEAITELVHSLSDDERRLVRECI